MANDQPKLITAMVIRSPLDQLSSKLLILENLINQLMQNEPLVNNYCHVSYRVCETNQMKARIEYYSQMTRDSIEIFKPFTKQNKCIVNAAITVHANMIAK